MAHEDADGFFLCPADGCQSDAPGPCPACGAALPPRALALSRRQRYVEDPASLTALRPSQKPYRWTSAAALALGVWLVTQPFAFEYRGLAPLASDVACGLAVGLLASLSLALRELAWASYLIALPGLWLTFAPMAFGTPLSGPGAWDPLIGASLVILSLVIPMAAELPGPEVPPGWTYNPSTWPQRAPVVALAFLGFLLARPMAAFGFGTTRWLGRFFGAAYLVEALAAAAGDARRWRTKPWLVALFGAIALPLAGAGALLAAVEPAAGGAWCALCMAAPAAAVLAAALSLDEIAASAQFLISSRRLGGSAWRAFWRGGTISGAAERAMPHRGPLWGPSAALWGFTVTPAGAASAAIGLLLAAAPAAPWLPRPLCDVDRAIGILVVAVAIVASAEVGRPARWLGAALAITLGIACWVLPGEPTLARAVSTAAAAVLVPLAVPVGRMRDHYAGLDPMVFWPRGLGRSFARRRTPSRR